MSSSKSLVLIFPVGVTILLAVPVGIWIVSAWLSGPRWVVNLSKWSAMLFVPFWLFVIIGTAKDSYIALFGDPNAKHLELKTTEVVDGVPLPAGSSASLYRNRLQVADLPAGPHTILGVPVTGQVSFTEGGLERGLLAEDHEFNGILCAKGTPVIFGSNGKSPSEYTIARAATILGQEWPVGTRVEGATESPSGSTYFHLPKGSPPKTIEGVTIGASPNFSIGLRGDGRLVGATVYPYDGIPAFIEVKGVKLGGGYVTFNPDGSVTGALEEDSVIDGKTVESGNSVTLSR